MTDEPMKPFLDELAILALKHGFTIKAAHIIETPADFAGYIAPGAGSGMFWANGRTLSEGFGDEVKSLDVTTLPKHERLKLMDGRADRFKAAFDDSRGTVPGGIDLSLDEVIQKQKTSDDEGQP